MAKWKFIAYGAHPCELILARQGPGGLIEQVASAYPSRQGYVYKLYPTSFRGFNTINQPIRISIHDIDMKGA